MDKFGEMLKLRTSSVIFTDFIQVVSGLKQRIDGLLTAEDASLLMEARTWFMARLIFPRHAPSTPRTHSVSSSSTDTPLVRGKTLTNQEDLVIYFFQLY